MAPPRARKTKIPDKLYFKIGEVSKIVGVGPPVLRYWETEFPSLKPGKARSRHRLYRRKDVELLVQIKRLLHTERFTIEGARKRLRDALKAEARPVKGAARELPRSEPYRTLLGRVKKEIEALCEMLR